MKIPCLVRWSSQQTKPPFRLGDFPAMFSRGYFHSQPWRGASAVHPSRTFARAGGPFFPSLMAHPMACHSRVQLLHLWLFRRKTHEMLRAMAAGLQFEAGETVCGLRLLGWRCCRRSETGGQALPKGWSFQCRISRIVWANSYEILHRDSKAVEKCVLLLNLLKEGQ